MARPIVGFCDRFQLKMKALVLAEKMLFPDRYSRVDSLALHGRRAAEIAVGAVMMLFVAAILEGEFRQLVASTPWRFVIAAEPVGTEVVHVVQPGGILVQLARGDALRGATAGRETSTR